MLAPRIIACLDVKDGQVVKGTQFRGHVVVGEILELARRYRDQGVDELVFYDITASAESRRVSRQWVTEVARLLDVPFCVAGGIRSVEDARQVLHSGADKVSINSPALENPQLVTQMAEVFGRQCVVVGVDSKSGPSADGGTDWFVHAYTGSEATSRLAGRRTLDWIAQAEHLGAGEIVLNCMDRDGMNSGYDLAQLSAARERLSIPLVASGGARTVDHFEQVFRQAKVNGALAAGAFHRGELLIPQLKSDLAARGIEVRP